MSSISLLTFNYVDKTIVECEVLKSLNNTILLVPSFPSVKEYLFYLCSATAYIYSCYRSFNVCPFIIKQGPSLLLVVIVF